MRAFLFFLTITFYNLQYAYAGAIQITPITINLSSATPIATLTVANLDNKPLIFQTSLFSWTQTKGADHYEITTDLLATPPIFTVQPGHEQILRVAYMGNSHDIALEKAYRIYLQEIVPSGTTLPSNQVQLLFKIGLPIFLQNSPSTDKGVNWQTHLIQKKVKIELDNNSNQHVHILSLSLTDAHHTSLPIDFMPAYVLAHQHRNWLLPISSSFYSPLLLNIKTDAGFYSFTLAR